MWERIFPHVVYSTRIGFSNTVIDEWCHGLYIISATAIIHFVFTSSVQFNQRHGFQMPHSLFNTVALARYCNKMFYFESGECCKLHYGEAINYTMEKQHPSTPSKVFWAFAEDVKALMISAHFFLNPFKVSRKLYESKMHHCRNFVWIYAQLLVLMVHLMARKCC